MQQFGVYSEVGKLRKVIVHRPDLSLKRLTPSNHDDLLFDDVLWVERAQWEHDQFVAAMRARGVEVFYLLDLLGEALAASDEGRRRLIERVASEYTVGWSLVDEVRELLWKMKPDLLAKHLIGGLTVGEMDLDFGQLRKVSLGAAALDDPGLLRAAAGAEFAVHARLFVLDLQRRLGQPDVLAGPAHGIAQPAGDLPLPPDVPGRRLRVLVSRTGDDGRFNAQDFGQRLAGRRRCDAHRQRHGADRDERAHARRA